MVGYSTPFDFRPGTLFYTTVFRWAKLVALSIDWVIVKYWLSPTFFPSYCSFLNLPQKMLYVFWYIVHACAKRISVITLNCTAIIILVHCTRAYGYPEAQGTWSPGNLEHREPEAQGTWSPGNLEHREPGAQGTWSPGNLEHREPEAQGTWSPGNL